MGLLHVRGFDWHPAVVSMPLPGLVRGKPLIALLLPRGDGAK